MKDRIRQTIEEHGQLSVPASELDDAADLYAAGMTSHASVSVMVGLEDEFGIEFPDSMLKREVFASVDSIAAALATLGERD